MRSCECRDLHEQRRIVVTGGPGAGKTAVLELFRQSSCSHVSVLPEAAGIVFGGGFPRGDANEPRCAAQRAIFYVQRELEATVAGTNAALVVCDRGTVDGAAYWPGPEELWGAVATTRAEQLARYHAVVHLRTPMADGGYNHQNPLRVESAVEAAVIDARIAECWAGHPRRFFVDADPSFLVKAQRALAILRAELPGCCA
jgi:predicted ATPase